LSYYFSPDPRSNIRSIILRSEDDIKEVFEIRRVFVHPGFTFPKLYNDIAVAELGKTERQRDRETERQRDGETERRRDGETDRQRDRETERQRDRETERQRDRETERQRDR
jgi:hypothetical protein